MTWSRAAKFGFGFCFLFAGLGCEDNRGKVTYAPPDDTRVEVESSLPAPRPPRKADKDAGATETPAKEPGAAGAAPGKATTASPAVK